MIIKELQLLSEALWESVKSDLKFFAPIKVFVKKLSEVDYTDSESLQDIKMYSDKIEEFFIEAGLFQGRLGFDRVIILKQDGIEEFSNIAGLQYIPFSGDNIEQCFYELQRKFKKLGLIK